MSMYSNRLRPALQKPITTCCSVLPREIVMHDDAYIGGRSENNIKCVVHDDLGWKNQTTWWYILLRHWLYEWFSQFHSCGTYSVLSRSPSYIYTYIHRNVGRRVQDTTRARRPCEDDDEYNEETEDDQKADGCDDPQQIDGRAVLQHPGFSHHCRVGCHGYRELCWCIQLRNKNKKLLQTSSKHCLSWLNCQLSSAR